MGMRKTLLIGIGAMVAASVARRTYLKQRFRFGGRVVVITGGSRGLGLVLARQLAAEGAHLVLLARNKEQLQRAADELRLMNARVLTIPCDVRDNSQVQAAIAQVVKRFGRIDVLINNAGVIQVGPLDAMTLQDFENAMAIHFLGALHTTLAVLPHMRASGAGRIVNITSIGGKIAIPHMIPYTASKFALVGLSDALRAELRRENIFVTTVVPGLMRTGSPPNATFKGNHRAENGWFTVADALPFISISAERAARKILAACRRRAPRLIISVPAKAAVLFSELFPDTTAHVSAQVNRLLPEASGEGIQEAHTGWESRSKRVPSFLTRLSDAATVRNNEYL